MLKCHKGRLQKLYKIKKLTQDDIPNYLHTGVSHSPCVLYGVHDKHFAWICAEEMCDFYYIKDNNIPYIKINGGGSTIVCSKGDLDLGFFGSKEFCEEMFMRISNMFSKILTGSKFINNDFMYDGNKYGAVTSINLGNVFYMGVHISNNINTELINRICLKKAYKKPERLPIQITEKEILDIYHDGVLV